MGNGKSTNTKKDTFYRKIFGRFYGTTSSAKISSIPHPSAQERVGRLSSGRLVLPTTLLPLWWWSGALCLGRGSDEGPGKLGQVLSKSSGELPVYLLGVLSISLYVLCIFFHDHFFQISFFRSSLSQGLSSWSSSKWQLSWLGLCQFSSIAKYQIMLVVYLHIHMIFICSFWQNIRVLSAVEVYKWV